MTMSPATFITLAVIAVSSQICLVAILVFRKQIGSAIERTSLRFKSGRSTAEVEVGTDAADESEKQPNLAGNVVRKVPN